MLQLLKNFKVTLVLGLLAVSVTPADLLKVNEYSKFRDLSPVLTHNAVSRAHSIFIIFTYHKGVPIFARLLEMTGNPPTNEISVLNTS